MRKRFTLPAKKMEHTATKYSKPTKARKISISILVISFPVLYVSLLRIPLSTLFSDTTFWFLLSNTIIIIIASDSGVFSASSSRTSNLYDEFIKHSQSQSSCLISQPIMAIVPREISTRQEHSKHLPLVSRVAKIPSSKEEVKVSNNPASPGGGVDNLSNKHTRSLSDGAVPNSAAIKKKKLHAQPQGIRNQKTLRRSVTENGDQRLEKNEYVNMSDEELNRRVEEFIKRFREIRLQEMDNE